MFQVHGIPTFFAGSDGTVKGGTSYPITVKKNLRGQQISMENLLPSVALVDSGGAFLPLQSEIFPDRDHGGRNFYNIAASSQLGIPQMSVGKACFSFPVRSFKSIPVLKTFRIGEYDFRV